MALVSTNREILTQFFEAVRNDIITEHLKLNQRASGRTLESLEIVVNDFKAQLWGAGYIGVLETGRKGGKVPKGFVNIILDWINAKGILPDGKISKMQWAYLIARKISIEGTLLNNKGRGGNSGVLSRAINEGRLSALIESLASKYQAETISEVVKGV
jgi:hypothetical protein